MKQDKEAKASDIESALDDAAIERLLGIKQEQQEQNHSSLLRNKINQVVDGLNGELCC